MKNIKCVSIKDERFIKIKNSLQKNLKKNNLQSYFPLSKCFDFHNNFKKLKLKNIYSILDIKEKILLEQDDTYVKIFLNVIL